MPGAGPDRAVRRPARGPLDSAFFSAATFALLEQAPIEVTISVPFERFVELKGLIEGRTPWRRLGPALAFFRTNWKPRRWASQAHFGATSRFAPVD